MRKSSIFQTLDTSLGLMLANVGRVTVTPTHPTTSLENHLFHRLPPTAASLWKPTPNKLQGNFQFSTQRYCLLIPGQDHPIQLSIPPRFHFCHPASQPWRAGEKLPQPGDQGEGKIQAPVTLSGWSSLELAGCNLLYP